MILRIIKLAIAFFITRLFDLLNPFTKTVSGWNGLSGWTF